MEVNASRHLGRGVVLIALVLAATPGCRASKSHHDDPVNGAATSQVTPTPLLQATRTQKSPVSSIDLLALLPACDVDHDGTMLDLGAPSIDGSGERDFSSETQSEPVQAIDRAGSTFLPVFERRFKREFWLDEATSEMSVHARIAGRSASA